jgi:hypothetical protein
MYWDSRLASAETLQKFNCCCISYSVNSRKGRFFPRKSFIIVVCIVIKKPAAYKPLTVHNPNLMSVSHRLGRLSRESVQVRGSLMTFVANWFFYGEGLTAPRPTPKLEDHPLSFVCGSLLNIFPATVHSWRPFLHPKSEDAPCCGLIRIMKSGRMRWAGYVARMEEKSNAYRLLVGKPEGRRSNFNQTWYKGLYIYIYGTQDYIYINYIYINECMCVCM